MNKTLPKDFDWQFYINYYPDLIPNGVDNEKKAISHFIKHGINEQRVYHKNHIRDRSPFFFIHTYKNLGTTVISQLPFEYKKRFYGWKTLGSWETENFEKLNTIEGYNHNKLLAIDHINISNSKKLGILDDEDLITRKFLGIVRHPIERILSMINYENSLSKINLDDFFKKLPFRKVTQKYSFESDNEIDLTLCLSSEKKYMENWFDNFNVNVSFDIWENKSPKNYNESNLNNFHYKIINEYFREDFELFEMLKTNKGIVNFKKYTTKNANISQI